jgi:hypothetical protein
MVLHLGLDFLVEIGFSGLLLTNSCHRRIN